MFFSKADLAHWFHILRRREGPEDWRTDVSRKQFSRISHMNMLTHTCAAQTLMIDARPKSFLCFPSLSLYISPFNLEQPYGLFLFLIP